MTTNERFLPDCEAFLFFPETGRPAFALDRQMPPFSMPPALPGSACIAISEK
jgi:hypothetical protein